MFSGFNLLILLFILFGIIIELASLIIGCIIVSGKIRSVKILGVGFIVSGIFGSFSQAAFLARFIVRTPDAITFLNNAELVMSVIASLFGTLCICLFVHKNYGCKWIYFPLFAQPVVSAFSRVVSAAVLSRAGSEMLVAGTGLSTSVTGLVTGSVSAVILIIVFFKNRKVEKIIPHAWIFRLVSYLWGIVLTIAGIAFYAYCLSGGSDSEMIYFNLLERFTLFQFTHSVISYIVSLAMPVYILVMAKRAERKLKETAPYIED